ncbi:MAG: trypsin-like peptidase domain-containing protein [Microlunatus sp.]
MTDQDRSAAAEGDRPAGESDADWFFRDRSGSAQHSDAPNAYYGPFGQRQPSADDPTRVLPGYGPSYPSPTGSPYPAPGPAASGGGTSQRPMQQTQLPPAAVRSPVPPQSPGRTATVTGGTPRRPRPGLVLLLSVLLAALVGTAAGYGGAKLANSGAPTPSTPSTAPLPRPSTTDGVPRTSVSPVPGQIDTVQVAATALPSTVMIRVGSGRSGGTGSGFVLDTDGHIMTNNHVVADAADGGRITVVFSDGAQVEAELVGRSPSYDLAVIKLDGEHDLVPMAIGDSDNVQVGESVVAIGSPLALASTVTQGIVSAKNRPVVVNSNSNAADSPSAYINGIQTDAAINPGNSGGPLVDAGARVIGVNSAILTLGQSADTGGNIGLGFAIPINQAMVIGKQLISEGRATYPVIGVNVGDDSGAGVRLSQVDADGPADQAGLRVDDVITKIDDQAVDTAAELIVAIRTHRPGDKVTLTYQRGAQEQTAEVTLGSREG